MDVIDRGSLFGAQVSTSLIVSPNLFVKSVLIGALEIGNESVINRSNKLRSSFKLVIHTGTFKSL